MTDYQHTVRETYRFEGKGLHTGAPVEMTILPAPDNYGIVFQRSDLGEDVFVEACISNISTTDRSTALCKDGVQVVTTEHLLSALSGLKIDNAHIQLNAPELPILDGSAAPYVEAILADGLMQQRSERKYITVDHPFEYYMDGSQVLVLPSDRFEVDVTIDFNSKVLGRQRAYYDDSMNYGKEIAPCRTFCFFHEIEYLLSKNLIKGGDVDNAIVVVEDEVTSDALERMKALFGRDDIQRVEEGYLNNVQLHFPNECARHKLLDVMGDFALLGAPLKGRIIAVKPGHRVNTNAVKSLYSQLER